MLPCRSDLKEIHIMGDMNLDSLDGRWQNVNYHLHSLAKLVQSACQLGNFSQLVQLPTRFQFDSVSGTTKVSCIDHVYTTHKFRCSGVNIIPFGNSDHELLEYVRYSKVPGTPSRTIRRRSYKDFTLQKFLADLGLVDWSPVYMNQDVDIAVNQFTQLFLKVLNVHAPWIVYQQRKKFTPWITNDTIKLMKERDAAKAKASKLAKNGVDSSAAWATYKKLQNNINNRIKHEERTYKNTKIKEDMCDPGKCGSTAKSFMNWPVSSGPPSALEVDGKLVNKASEIAILMNDFLISKVQKIRGGIALVQNSFLKCHGRKNCQLTLQHVTVAKVTRLLKNLKKSKSTSIDGLDNFCVKAASEIIAQPVHHIVTLSLMQRKFPSAWKLSKIIPLYKKDSKLDCKNYRPVAILSPLSKILEKLVYEQIYGYFARNRIFHPNLHGFRKNHSTQTALLTIYDRWVRGASEGKLSGAVLLDLSAAFDLVDHNLLVQKLKIYGLREDYLEWISE